MRSQASFGFQYQRLEKEMQRQAEADGAIFLPNVEPDRPVDYIFICMEPSLVRWARDSPACAKARVEAGFRNFLPSDDVALLHFCIQKYLHCRPGHYHITDVSKGAMKVQDAGREREARWDNWFPLLQEEIKLLAAPHARLVAVGSKVHCFLERKSPDRDLRKIIHYSPLAASARITGVAGKQSKFDAFKNSVSKDDLMAAARDVLAWAGIPPNSSEETLGKLDRFALTCSRLKLIFNYKEAFERFREE